MKNFYICSEEDGKTMEFYEYKGEMILLHLMGPLLATIVKPD